MAEKRRTFLKKIGTVSAGLGLTSLSPLLPDSKHQHSLKGSMEFEEDKSYTVTILQSTDVHCQIHPHDELFWENEQMVFRKTGGYAQLATFFKKQRKINPDTFILDTGDMFQGSELSVKTTGKAMIPLLDELGYDLYLPGNWEVIYGKRNLQTLMGALAAPKICANMYHDLGDKKRGELIFLPYHIWNIRGIKIGFLGYTDPYVPIRQSPAYSKGILYTPPEENLAHYVSVLKGDEQCDYVIILAHLGLSQQIYLAGLPQCEGVDYILGGDTHERVRKPIQCKYAKVVEPGAFGSFVGSLKLTVQNGKVVRDDYELLEIDTDAWKPDETMAHLIDSNEFPFEKDINKVVGYSTLPLYRYFVIENTIDTLVLDALSWQVPEVDIVFSNGFRFCPPLATHDHTDNIPITEGYIFDMLPVDSVVRKGKATGTQIKDWLENEINNVFAKNAAERLGGWLVKFRGMEITFNAFGEKGKRVQSVSVRGEPLKLQKIYSICACEREGDPPDVLCRMKGVKEAVNTKYTLHGLMRSYLEKNSPVTPAPQMAAVILDGPQTLLTQVSGVDYKFY